MKKKRKKSKKRKRIKGRARASREFIGDRPIDVIKRRRELKNESVANSKLGQESSE